VSERLNRRDFLRASVIAGAGATLYGISRQIDKQYKDPTFKIEFDHEPLVSFKEASDFLLRMDGLQDKLEEPIIPATPQNITALVQEIVPYFEREGATDNAWFPKDVNYFVARDDGTHMNVSGRSDCDRFVVNYRHANPWSAWSKDSDWIGTVVHETAHVQQRPDVCFNSERVNVENTAQIVATEVMAGMVNDRNDLMVYPLIDELKSYAGGTAYSIALRDKRLDDYERLRRKVKNSPRSEAGYQRSRRYWRGKQDQLNFILTAYYELPFNKIVGGIRENNNYIYDLALPSHFNTMGQNRPRRFKVDDIQYFLENAEERVEEIADVQRNQRR
jgi:hypothetical protein